MTRMNAREIAVQIVFAAGNSGFGFSECADSILTADSFESLSSESELYLSFPGKKQLRYIKTLVSLIDENLTEIDSLISQHCIGWSISRLSGTATSVLRCAFAEMLFITDIPYAVSINSAVEISKHYDDSSTVSFINGVLGAFADSLQEK